jgi:hypothetical protein
MPIDTEHEDRAAWSSRWRRCRDAVSGQHAVHQAGELYLPALKEQDAAEYRAYKERATWYGATGRTLQGLCGMVFRRAPMLEAPDALKAIAEDLTLAGHNADLVARDLLSQVLAVGRVGALVEYPADTMGPVTLAQAASMNRRPYVTTWPTESILNWRMGRVANKLQPVLVVLHEMAEVIDAQDPYKPGKVPQIRALLLEDGRYIQRVYQQSKDKGEWQLVAEIVPIKNGAPLGSIPFVCVGPDELSLNVQKPPMLDLIDVNVSHYKNTADLEHGAHFAGLPTPVVTGYEAMAGEKLCIGSAAAWVFPNPDAKATFLEFTGQGLGALENRCKVKEAQMAALGARMLAPEKAGIESSDALSSRHNGENAALADIANQVSDAMTIILRMAAEWEGIAGEVSYKLSTDYTPSGLTAQQLTALVQAWQAGGISWETFFWNLKEGEIVSEKVTEDEERDRIDAAGPPLGMAGAMNDSQQQAA